MAHHIDAPFKLRYQVINLEKVSITIKWPILLDVYMLLTLVPQCMVFQRI